MSSIERLAESRFASIEETLSEPFLAVARRIDELVVRHGLPDHTELNQERFPWAQGLLSTPAFYASRLWEYPYAILSAELKPAMTCADIGCGMTGFTPYLKDVAGCDVTGVDPDIFDEGIKYGGHGVNQAFIQATGLKVLQGFMEALPLEDNSQDRVFCISVIEHVPHDIARRGMQEMARVLKPGGRAIVTMDVNMWSEINRPLDLVWESGLTLPGGLDLRWPKRRFGIFCDGQQPADVIGFVLHKADATVETQYHVGNERVPEVPLHLVPTLMVQAEASNGQPAEANARPLWRRVGGRILREARKVGSNSK
jgi:SAM-dependent methyltransferase